MKKYLAASLGSAFLLLATAVWQAGALAYQQPQAEPQMPPTPEKLEDPAGIHNLLKLSERVYSGSEPHGEEAFKNLQKLGVKTVVSVDGARPNLELAAKYGLRYVHIPIGYHGVDAEPAKALVRVAREVEGPIYVHCHHGRHRGPAAAAVVCMAADGRTGAQASEILKAAGTGENYAGLWRDVAIYEPPAADAVLPELKEFVEVDSLAAAMAKLDRNFDNLKLCRTANWATPADHPDLAPAQEALILREGLREAARHLMEDHGEEFRAWLKESESHAQALEEALAATQREPAEVHFTALEASCKQCHKKYRD